MSKVVRSRAAVTLPTLLQIALVLLIFAIAFYSPNTGTNSDSRYTLLVSEALLRQHTVRLDAYRDDIGNKQTVEYRLWEKDGHLYYVYPLGSSILAVPFVIPLILLDKSMSVPAHEDAAQNLLSALVLVAIFLVLDRIGRYYLSPVASLLLVTVCILGSTLMSALGTALWNQSFTVLCVSLCLWLLVRLENDAAFPLLPWLLGLFLFLAYLCRPTTAVFIAPVLIFLFFKHRRQFWPTALTAFVLLVLFILFSRYEFGLWLPIYYLPSQLGGLLDYGSQQTTPLPLALYGLLFSPSRGLFVYSTIFLLAIIGALCYRHVVKQHPLWWLITFWAVGHVMVVARFPNWWGGFSFGPRLLTDMLPGLALLTMFVGQGWLEDQPGRGKKLAFLLFLTAVTVSIFINSYVGMFSQTMLLSFGNSLPPHVDKAPFLLLDWRFPQFLTTPDSACLRNKTYFQTLIAEDVVQVEPYTLGQEVQAQIAGNYQNFPTWAWWISPPKEASSYQALISVGRFLTYFPLILKPSVIPPQQAIFIGWGLPGEHETWTACHTVSIIIGPMRAVTPNEQLTLKIIGRGHQTQPVLVSINGESVGQFTFSPATCEETLTFPGELLHIDQPNKISMDLPQAFAPESAIEQLPLGIFLEKLLIEPAVNK